MILDLWGIIEGKACRGGADGQGLDGIEALNKLCLSTCVFKGGNHETNSGTVIGRETEKVRSNGTVVLATGTGKRGSTVWSEATSRVGW